MTCPPSVKQSEGLAHPCDVLPSGSHNPATRPRQKPVARVSLGPAILFLACLVWGGFARPQEQPANPPSNFFVRVIANQKHSEILLDEYARTQCTEKRRTASDPKPLTVTCVRIFPAGPANSKIALSDDGKEPNDEVYRGELEKVEKYLSWILQEGAAQKEAYAKAERKRKERFELMDATHEAFRFKLEGKELRGNRTLLRYAMEPNPSYRPTSRNTVIFSKVRGTLWVDEESSQLAKIDGSVTEDFSIALFLAKVYKGSHFMQERYEVTPGLWAPTFEQYDFDGRKFMVSFAIHERTFYKDYQYIGKPSEALEYVRGKLSKLQITESSR